MFHFATLQDIVSLSLVPCIGFPLCMGLAYNDIGYVSIFVGALTVGFTTNVLKVATSYLTDDPLFYRPRGATYCTLLNGRCNPRAPAFPSGHVAVATFITCSLYQYQRASMVGMFTRGVLAVVYVIYVTMMAYSRYAKRCHNVPQIVGGVCYGYTAFMLFSSM